MRAQLAIGLQGIVTQTLVPTADGKGRAVAAEVLVPTPGVRNLIREGKTHQIYSLIQTGAVHGMQTMDASLAGPRPRRQDHAGDRGDPLLDAEELRKLIEMPAGTRPSFEGRRPDGHLRVQGGRPRGHPAERARSRASTRSAVTAELKAKGLKVMTLEEKKSGAQDGASASARSRSRPPS